jgi:integrase
MIHLPNGCYCSGIAGNAKKGTTDSLPIYPQSWKSARASIKKDWYLQYRFYDPSIKVGKYAGKGKLCIVKGGVNKYKTLEERQFAIEYLMKEEVLLLQRGYNPILDKVIKTETTVPDGISSSTPFIEALKFALKNLPGVHETKLDAKSVLLYVSEAAIKLMYHHLPIAMIKKGHIKTLLDYMQEYNISKIDKEGNKKEFTNAKYNRYRANLLMLFKVLIDYGIFETNFVEKVPRKKAVRKKRRVLTKEERKEVVDHLAKCNPVFLRFIRIFHDSGGRETELMNLRGRDVDLINQTYRSVVKKGFQYTEEERTISNSVLPYWKEQMETCGPDDYVFSVGINPGPIKISPRQITRRWKRWVKDPLKISVDFYAFKHLKTTETINRVHDEIKAAQRVAAAQNAHTTEEMVARVYDINSKERIHEMLKEAGSDL